MRSMMKNIYIKAGIIAVIALLLMGGLWLHTPITVSAAAGEPNTPRVYLDVSNAIQDPRRVSSSEGTRYMPTTYIYFGEVYDPATQTYVPVLNRVLDADLDNTGAEGAIFLLTETTVNSRAFSAYNSDTSNFMDDENQYLNSLILLNIHTYESLFERNEQFGVSYELQYIRPVSKSDSESDMDGLYGMSAAGGYNYWEGADNILNSQQVFLLSAREIYDYVATYRGAPELRAKGAGTGNYESWWLRTAVSDVQGNFVGLVDTNGNVGIGDANDVAGVRLGFNIEKEHIAFAVELEEGVYRLAMKDTTYLSESTLPFAAELYDIRDGKVYLDVWNYIAESYVGNIDDPYISYMILDDSGNVKYYGVADELSSGNGDNKQHGEDSKVRVSFELPACYEEGDTLRVFWERINDDYKEGTSYVSNFVDIECVHSTDDAHRANCSALATCLRCGETYGDYDKSRHVNLSDVYATDKVARTHTIQCADCGEMTKPVACSYSGKTTPGNCIDYCVCGYVPPIAGIHDFDEDGFCYYDGNHFEMPSVAELSNWGVEVTILTTGQWNAYASMINKGESYLSIGEMKLVYIEADLDFTGKTFVPMGTVENPAINLHVYGNYHTIKGIRVEDPSRQGVGLLGVADNAMVEELFINDCHFAGASDVGAVIGYAKGNECAVSTVFVKDTVVTSADGTPGGVIGACEGGANLTSALLYNVTDQEGNHLDFSGDGKAKANTAGANEIGGSYRLAETSDGVHAVSAEDFASGMVAYRLYKVDRNWRQTLGSNPVPVYAPDTQNNVVYKVVSCDGKTTVYMNENIGQLSHGDYTEICGDIVWLDDTGEFGIGAEIPVRCGDCAQIITVACELEYRFYANGTLIAKMDATPYLTINGDYQKVGEIKTIISTRLENLIGMTNQVRTYNGAYVSPEELMDNHRLVTSPSALKEYEVFFVNPKTGEKYLQSGYDYYGQLYYYADLVMDVGTYDLLVEGRSIFEGQEVLYKGALVIEPVVITVFPADVYKYYDGNGNFEAVWTLDNEDFEPEAFRVTFSAADSSAPGRYPLTVKVDANAHNYGKNITLKLDRDTVDGLILPNIHLSISNKSYPTEVTYGDTLPTPSESHFNLSAPANITYEWYEGEYDYWEETYILGKRLNGTPVNAGSYVLRVRATSKDESLVSATLDVGVTINQKTVSLVLTPPAGAKTEERYGGTVYLLNPGDMFTYTVKGLVNGDTLASTGMVVELHVRDGSYYGSNTFPVSPLDGYEDYYISYSVSMTDNYTCDTYESVYVDILAPDYTYPVTSYRDENGSRGATIVVCGPAVGITNGSDTEFSYGMTIKDANGRVVAEKEGEGSDPTDIYGYFGDDGEFVSAGKYTAEVTVGDVRYSFDFYVSYQNDKGESLSSIPAELGRYTVSVSMDDNAQTEDIQSAYVFVQREISMTLKPHYYNLTDSSLPFDPTKVEMEAGKVVLLGHTIEKAYFDMNIEYGNIYVRAIQVVDENGNDVSYLYKVTYSYGPDKNLLHVFDGACDDTCNVYGCEELRATEGHSGGKATCCARAICDECSMPYGELLKSRHLSTATKLIANPTQPDSGHVAVYVCCGGVKAELEHTPVSPATCTARSTCSVCGIPYGDVDPNNHANDERSYRTEGESGHATTYLCCGAIKTERHEGGTALCNARAKCDLCSGEYGEMNPLNHAKAAVFRPDPQDREKHNKEYDCCGHSTSYSHEGGRATCISFAVCEKCNGEYGEKSLDDHATDTYRYELHPDNPSLHNVYRDCCGAYEDKEHHAGGTANCQNGAICTACLSAYGDRNPNVHESEAYRYIKHMENADLHVKITVCCDEAVSEEPHNYGAATCAHPERCACGAEQGNALEHTYDHECDAVCNVCGKQTRAERLHQENPDGSACEICGEPLEKQPLSGGVISGIVTGSAVVASTGGFSLFWFVIRKKSWAELLMLK